MSVAVWAGVALLSGLGAILRFELHTWAQRRAATGFPVGTLVVNALGSLALGVLHGAGVTGDALLLAGTALLGSFTTFSTWMLETASLGERGQGRLALASLALSLAAGLTAVALGWSAGSLL
jgi:fluoride exporter